jgi:hypothetical protein
MRRKSDAPGRSASCASSLKQDIVATGRPAFSECSRRKASCLPVQRADRREHVDLVLDRLLAQPSALLDCGNERVERQRQRRVIRLGEVDFEETLARSAGP